MEDANWCLSWLYRFGREIEPSKYKREVNSTFAGTTVRLALRVNRPLHFPPKNQIPEIEYPSCRHRILN